MEVSAEMMWDSCYHLQSAVASCAKSDQSGKQQQTRIVGSWWQFGPRTQQCQKSVASRKTVAGLLHCCMIQVTRSGPIGGVLSGEDVAAYYAFLRDQKVLTRLVTDTFTIIEQSHRGMTQEDLSGMVAHHRARGNTIEADLLDQVFLVGEGSAMFLQSVPASNEFVNVILIYAERADGKYDLVVAKGEQKKTFDRTKLCAAGGAALGLGAGGTALAHYAGAAFGPAVGTGLTIFTLFSGGTAYKLHHDYNEPIQNVVNGFLLNSLERKGLIAIDGQGAIRMNFF